MMIKRKKIYFLINSLEWWWAERVVTTFAQQLSQDHDVTIITLKDAVFYTVPSWVHYVALSKTAHNRAMFFLFPRYIYRFKKFLKHEQFDSGISFLEIANFVHIFAKKDAIISFRTHTSFFQWILGKLYLLLIKWLYPKAASIVVNSEENRYDLADYLRYDINHITTLYNPINTDRITQLRREPLDNTLLAKLRNKTVFITVARLVSPKYHEKLIASLAQMKHRDRVYLIVWDGPRRSTLEQLSAHYQLQDNIIFLGKQSNVFRYLDKADYFVYASKVEWFPNVLIEAMACNLPIITSDFVSWAQEIIFGVFDKKRILTYPAYGPNGVLLDLEMYEENRLEIIENLNILVQEQQWFQKFSHYFQHHIENILFK